MGKRKRRKSKVESIGRMADDALGTLEKVKGILAAVTGITSSLHSLTSTYRLAQADGSLGVILSALDGRKSEDKESESVELET